VVLTCALLSPALPCAAAPDPFPTEIRPLVVKYCFSCHGDAKARGDVSFAAVRDASAVHRDPKFWQTVARQLTDRAMPPEGKPQPTEGERQRLIDWINGSLASLDLSKVPTDPGRTTIRRLNRVEYNHTLRDLIGVDSNPADTFPADGGGGGGFDNNADTLFIPPLLMEQYLRAAGDVLAEAKPDRYLATRPAANTPKGPAGAGPRRSAARACIDRFASRAFRRPATPDEVARYLRLFDAADARGNAFDDSVRLACKAILVAPHFLFRIEPDRPGAKEPYAVTDYELASRLSYFLWSSMPDDELLSLAAKGRLRDDATLVAQARRMLKDPRSRALAEQFGGQWLEFREIRTVAQPDKRRFPEFTGGLRAAMHEEAVRLIDSVFRDDASLLTLIDADYTYLNEPLAKHYGIPNVTGPEFRRVKLADRTRGGVLGLGAVLTVSSYPLRTSPVLRGKWVLDALLGAPPPPPPPDVPELPQDDKQSEGLSFRKRLEMHRTNPQCASCHNRMIGAFKAIFYGNMARS